MEKQTKKFADLPSAIEAYRTANGNPAPIYVLNLSNFGNHWGLERVAASTDLEQIWQLIKSSHNKEDIARVDDYLETFNKVEIQLSKNFAIDYYTYNKLVIERIQVIY